MPIVYISGVSLIALMIIGVILARMYVKSSPQTAFVRTGLGGKKVIREGGAIVLPVLHQIILVNLNTLKLVVTKKDNDGLITNDRMRVDVVAEFYLRVKPDAEAIANAAQTLGERTCNPERLRELMEGKFVDALRAVAAEMTMEQLHEMRADFMQRVQSNVAEELNKNGIELETVSLTGLDQTNIELFSDTNAFDAEGKTKLTRIIETKRKERNDIEQDNSVLIEKKNLEAIQKKLQIEKERQYSTLSQQREIATQTALENASIQKEEAFRKKEAEEARIEANEAIELRSISKDKVIEEGKIHQERAVLEAEIIKEKAVELANQQRDIEIAEKSKEHSKAAEEANIARARAIAAEEKVTTAKETEIATRKKDIAVLKAKESAESDAAMILVKADAEKKAATDKADAVKISAQAEADAIIIKAQAKGKDYEADAIGKEKLNEAENKLSTQIINMRITIETIRQLPAIVEASVKPLEKIDSFKVINLGGLDKLTGGSSEAPGSQDLASQLLRYRANAPLIDSLLKQSGIAESLEEIVGGRAESLTKNMVTKSDLPEDTEV